MFLVSDHNLLPCLVNFLETLWRFKIVIMIDTLPDLANLEVQHCLSIERFMMCNAPFSFATRISMLAILADIGMGSKARRNIQSREGRDPHQFRSA